jgi:hypothetical protein
MNDQEFLEQLKSILRITWDDENEELMNLLLRSKVYLQQLCGAAFDFFSEEQPLSLLLERCRYVYNNAGDEFEKNYQHELSRLILQVALGKVGVADGNETVS